MRPRIADIVALASDVSGIPSERIYGQRRTREIVRVRMACYLVARETGVSYPEIGRIMCRDHSTVIHGERIAQDTARRDPEYAKFVAELREKARTAERFIADRINRFGNRPLRMAIAVSYRLPVAGAGPQLEVVSPAQPILKAPLTEDEIEDQRIHEERVQARIASRALRDAIFAARAAA